VIGAVIAAQARLVREEGVEHTYACLPLLTWADILREQGYADEALRRYQAALERARAVQELRGTVSSLAGTAIVAMTVGRLEEAAWLFGAAEAFCDRSGLTFRTDVWIDVCAWGLPLSWQRDEAGPEVRADGVDAGGSDHGARRPPIPDPDAQAWIAGWSVPIGEAVTVALAVDLSSPSRGVPRRPSLAAPPQGILSPREQEVLVLLCQRLTDPQIAERLFLSPRTVESHVASLLRKLDVANRRDTAAAAVRLGLV
jgi:DNA-binding CsgD family transcriptional regulator